VNADTTVELPALAPEPDALLGWAVREGTTNALRHSSASYCHILADVRDGDLRLELTNDGVTLSEGEGGSGLTGLAERVSQRGGTLSAGPTGEGCFQLRVLLPETTT